MASSESRLRRVMRCSCSGCSKAPTDHSPHRTEPRPPRVVFELGKRSAVRASVDHGGIELHRRVEEALCELALMGRHLIMWKHLAGPTSPILIERRFTGRIRRPKRATASQHSPSGALTALNRACRNPRACLRKTVLFGVYPKNPAVSISKDDPRLRAAELTEDEFLGSLDIHNHAGMDFLDAYRGAYPWAELPRHTMIQPREGIFCTMIRAREVLRWCFSTSMASWLACSRATT